MLELQFEIIIQENHDSLGHWLARRLRSVMEREALALKAIADSGLTEETLQQQWLLQREAQKATPKGDIPRRRRCRTDFYSVTSLALTKIMAEIARLEDRIEEIDESIAQFSELPAVRRPLSESRLALEAQITQIWTAQHLIDEYPLAKEFGQPFIRQLITVSNLRQQATQKIVARFLSVSRINQAKGGVHSSLGAFGAHGAAGTVVPNHLINHTGTNDDQKLLSRIQSSSKPLERVIARFNTAVDHLQLLLPPGKTFPMPPRFPEKLHLLKASPEAFSQVFTGMIDFKAHEYLFNPVVRAAMHGWHMKLRCQEERLRLEVEEQRLRNYILTRCKQIEYLAGVPACESFILHRKNIFSQRRRRRADHLWRPFLVQRALHMERLVAGCHDLMTPHATFSGPLLPALASLAPELVTGPRVAPFRGFDTPTTGTHQFFTHDDAHQEQNRVGMGAERMLASRVAAPTAPPDVPDSPIAPRPMLGMGIEADHFQWAFDSRVGSPNFFPDHSDHELSEEEDWEVSQNYIGSEHSSDSSDSDSEILE